MFEIEVEATHGGDDDVELIRDAIAAALQQQQAPSPATVAVMLTNDEELHALNSRYRGIDKSTDVLSFEDGEPPFPGADVHLGDIAISLPQAQKQADAGGHAVSAELQLLAVHGALHLVGHDHATPDEKAAMWQAQATILKQIGCPISGPVIEQEG